MNFIKSLNILILKLIWIILKLLKCTCRNNIEEKEIVLWRRLNKNRNKSKELWKALKSLGLSSDKARKSKIYLKKRWYNSIRNTGNANTFKRCFSELAGVLQEKLPKAPTNLLFKQPKTTSPRLHATYPMALNCQMYLEKLLKRFYVVSIPVKPLEWTKFQQNFWGMMMKALRLRDIITLSI